MTHRIEQFDMKRKRLRGGHILSIIAFFLTWMAFVVLEFAHLEESRLSKILLIICYIFLLAVIFFAVRLRRNAYLINRDPVLREALNNELVQINRLKAWRTAFIAMAVFLAATGLLSLFVEIKNLMIVASSLIVGLGSQRITFFLLDK
jgi:hypothetical protein